MDGSRGSHDSCLHAPEVPLTICSNAHSPIKCETCRLRELSLCDALSPSELGELDKLSTSLTYRAKVTIFDQDEAADNVFNITSGAVRLSRLLADGQMQVFGFALPGDFLGLSMSERNAFSADTLVATTACRFSRQQFSTLLDHKPHLLRRLHTMASHELSLAQDQMILLGRHSVEERMAAFLLTMRNRLNRISSTEAYVPLPMTRRDIGDFLGITTESASRQINQFSRQKVLVVESGGVRLVDISCLQRLAGN